MVTTHLPFDRYGFLHVATHLARAGRVADLYGLVTSEAWWQSQQTIDPGRQFLRNQVNLAYDALEQVVDDDPTDSSSPERLAWLTVLAWISAWIGQAANRVPAAVLEAMARLGRFEEARHRAAVIPDPVRRGEGLLWIGLAVFEAGDPESAHEVWEDAYLALSALVPDLFDESLEILSELVVILVKAGSRERAHSVVKELESWVHTKQAGVGASSNAWIALMRAWTALDAIHPAIQLLDEIHGPDQKIKALWTVAQVQLTLHKPIRHEIIERATALEPAQAEVPVRRQLADLQAWGGQFDAAEASLGEAPGLIDQMGVLRAQITFLTNHGADRQAVSRVFATLVEKLVAISEVELRLSLMADLVLGPPTLQRQPVLQDLLPILQQDFDTHQHPMDITQYGRIALALHALGDGARAGLAVQAGLASLQVIEDWNETQTLLKFAEVFGAGQDELRFRQLLERVRGKTNVWQKAEIQATLARWVAGFTMPSLSEAVARELILLLEDQDAMVRQPFSLVPLATWIFNSRGEEHSVHRQRLLERLDQTLEADGLEAHQFAFMALRFALRGFATWSSRMIDKALAAVQQEADPNLVVVVLGSLAEAARASRQTDLLIKLQEIARSLEDPWLQAEALFRLAYAWASLQDHATALTLFRQAWQSGAEPDGLPTEIDAFGSASQAEAFFSGASFMEWHAIKAASIQAWLAIAARRPATWFAEVALKLIGQIPDEYSEMRAECLDRWLSTVQPARPAELVKLYLQALRTVRDRTTDDVWAVFYAGFEELQRVWMDACILKFWDEWLRVGRHLA